jgi:hypothetical protein
VLDRVVFTDLTLHSVIAPTPVWRKCVRGGCHPDAVVLSAVRNNKTSCESECTRHRTGISDILETEAVIAEISLPYHNEQVPRSSFFSTASI